MVNCLIIGLGNIGQRHLESLAKSRSKINFFILEKNELVLKKFKKKKIDFKKHNYHFYQSLSNIRENYFDFTIFATNSNNRYKLFEAVSSKKKLKNIIFEKVVFQSIFQFKKAFKILNKNKIKAWVNCPRRNMFFFKNLKKSVKYKRNFIMTFEGNKWNLCSNTIHFLDLFFFYIGIKKDISFNDHLLKKLIKSKRKGFYETQGKIEFFTKSFREKLILSDNKSQKKLSTLKIKYDDYRLLVILNNKKNNVSFYFKDKLINKDTFSMPYQSQMTLGVFKDIMNKNNCDLATLNESFHHHKILFLVFNNFFKKTLNKKRIINCPIT